MRGVKLHIAQDGEPLAVEVAPGEAVLIGRAPDETRLPASLPERAPGPLTPVAVPRANVSANHVLAWDEDGGLGLRDLASKNGSWLRLPRDHAIHVPPSARVDLFIGGAPDRAPGVDRAFVEPRWDRSEEFAAAVRDAIERWLRRVGVSLAVEVVGADRARESRPQAARGSSPAVVPLDDRIPLASGEWLWLALAETADSALESVTEKIWRFVEAQNARYVAEQSASAEGMILASPAIREAHARTVEAARAGARLLLLGPSGSGKDELARAYHRHSERSGAFVAVNCSTLNKDLLYSQLFGAQKGAYTDAVRDVVGAVERAHGGTLFLDEIGDTPLEVQPMLLRFLDRGEFQRLGENGSARVADVRLVCATNKDLRSASRQGEFRADLWFRISQRVVEVPPLDQRPEDVVAFLKSRPLDRVAGAVTAYDALAPDALAALLAHPFTGHFRELANFVSGLPRAARRGDVGVTQCQALLTQGSLTPTAAPPRPAAARPATGVPPVAALAERAASAFALDRGKTHPESWDEVKDLIENYYKPLLFAHLSGAAAEPDAAGDVRRFSKALDADRGTAGKQLARWAERFRD